MQILQTQRDAPLPSMSHFLLLTYALPGHINPSLQFANTLVRTGARVTFLTTIYAHQRMTKSTPPDGRTYATFSDSYNDGATSADDRANVRVQFRLRGSDALARRLRTLEEERRPVTCVIYTLLNSWAADVARGLHTPHVLLWIQPATVFTVYYHYFHGYEDLITKSIEKDPSASIELPGLPPLTSAELPSFLHPSAPYHEILSSFRDQFEVLDRDERMRVLVNTFDEAEQDAIMAIDPVDQVGVGPLTPPAFFDGKGGSHATDDGEMYKNSLGNNYMEWLDSKPESSVVYVSFGSMVVLEEKQMVEILTGLLESSHPFLWVIRPGDNGGERDEKARFWEKVCAVEERKEGMVVAWCSQLKVLSHSSVGCFLSHCGWNSTTESLAKGVPLVCLPRWSDQTTNGKLVEDVWKAGVRAKTNREGVSECGEVKRCLDLVMGVECGEEIRKNALRWRNLAKKSLGEGGSSDRNIQAFLGEMRDCNDARGQ